MPSFPIIDTHLHIWDPARLNYPWHASVPALNRPFLLGDFDEHRADTDVERMVFLECDVAPGDRLDEAKWVSECAAADHRIEAIIASAPLENGAEVEADLLALAELPLVRGIRRLIQDEPDDDFCVQPGFVEGVKRLPAHGFSFDICIKHRHMANAVELVRQCPEVSFILDHIGKPAVRDGLLEPWKQQLCAMAALPNVTCKMSGLVTEADHDHWTRDQLRPYIDHVIECFGFDRVMYGGDWPVSTQATRYPEWVATLDSALSGCSADELRRIYRENAIAFYRLS